MVPLDCASVGLGNPFSKLFVRVHVRPKTSVTPSCLKDQTDYPVQTIGAITSEVKRELALGWTAGRGNNTSARGKRFPPTGADQIEDLSQNKFALRVKSCAYSLFA